MSNKVTKNIEKTKKEIAETMTTADMAAFDAPALRIKRVNDFNPWGTAQNTKENLKENHNHGLILKSNNLDKVCQILDKTDFYYEDGDGTYIILPEDEENYDALEKEIEAKILSIDRNLNFSFEGIWEDENGSNDEQIYNDQQEEEETYYREQGLIESVLIDDNVAVDEGHEAAKQGKFLSDCPYPVGSEERSDWIDGYDSYADAGRGKYPSYAEEIGIALHENYGGGVGDILELGWEIWYHAEELSSFTGIGESRGQLLKNVAHLLLDTKPGMTFWQIVKKLKNFNMEAFKLFLRAIKIIVFSSSLEIANQRLNQMGLGVMTPAIEKVTSIPQQRVNNAVMYNEAKNNKMENNWLNEVRKSKMLLEGSYDDFLDNYGMELNKALKKLRHLNKKITSIINTGNIAEEKLFKRVRQIYDKQVSDFVYKAIFSAEFYYTTNDLVKVAIENQDRNGTEPQELINAINDVWIASQSMKELQESFNIYNDKFVLKEHNLLTKPKEDKEFKFILETNAHGSQLLKIDQKKFIQFIKENCDIEKHTKNGIFEYKSYVSSRTITFLNTILNEYLNTIKKQLREGKDPEWLYNFISKYQNDPVEQIQSIIMQEINCTQDEAKRLIMAWALGRSDFEKKYSALVNKGQVQEQVKKKVTEGFRTKDFTEWIENVKSKGIKYQLKTDKKTGTTKVYDENEKEFGEWDSDNLFGKVR